jgi:hypothetical protein
MNGRKTWIGLIITFAPMLLKTAGEMIASGSVDPYKIAQVVGEALAIIGAGHKLVKGDGVPVAAPAETPVGQ